MDNDAAILQMMGDVREDIRVGFTNMSKKLDDHIQQTNEKFEAIHVQQAADKGAAEQKAKVYGFLGAGFATFLGGSWELIKYIWHR